MLLKRTQNAGDVLTHDQKRTVAKSRVTMFLLPYFGL